MPNKYIWNTKYTTQHSVERSQTTKYIQYNIDDTKSRELPDFFHMFFKSYIGFMLSNCMNEKNVYTLYVFQKLCCFRAIKLCKYQKNAFGIRNTQYCIKLSVHKQTSVYNITYTLQSRVNCPNVSPLHTPDS